MIWKVEFATRREELVYAAILVTDQEPEIGTVLVCEESGAKYRLLAIAMASAAAWERGQRSLQLEPIEGGAGGKPLGEGMHLSC